MNKDTGFDPEPTVINGLGRIEGGSSRVAVAKAPAAGALAGRLALYAVAVLFLCFCLFPLVVISSDLSEDPGRHLCQPAGLAFRADLG